MFNFPKQSGDLNLICDLFQYMIVNYEADSAVTFSTFVGIYIGVVLQCLHTVAL